MKTLDYKKATLEQMLDYIEENAPEDRKWFSSIAFKEVPAKRKRVYVKDENGNPIKKVNKKGEEYFVQRFEVDKDCKETKLQFQMIEAKRAFFKRYMPEAMPQKAKTSVDRLLSWRSLEDGKKTKGTK